MVSSNADGLGLLRSALHSLSGAATDFDPLIDLAGEAAYVLLGEASHGTHEFYSRRAEITKRLIQEKGIQAVAAEADWPDAHRVNRYVHGHSEDRWTAQALSGFTRFPVWMWRNRDVESFVNWLRQYNDWRPAHALQRGFTGWICTA